MKPFIAIVLLVMSYTSHANNLDLNTDITQEPTLQELIGRHENDPLFLGHIRSSSIIYPIENGAEACTARGCLNGCTIGYGYNFGSKTTQDVWDHFREIDTEEHIIKVFINFAGKTGTEAFELCGSVNTKDRSFFSPIDAEEAMKLMQVMIREHQQYVTDAIREKFQEDADKYINQEMYILLIALDYQSRNIASNASKLFAAIKNHDFNGVIYEIKCNSGSQLAPELQRRRNIEAKFMAAAMNKLLNINHNPDTITCQK